MSCAPSVTAASLPSVERVLASFARDSRVPSQIALSLAGVSFAQLPADVISANRGINR